MEMYLDDLPTSVKRKVVSLHAKIDNISKNLSLIGFIRNRTHYNDLLLSIEQLDEAFENGDLKSIKKNLLDAEKSCSASLLLVDETKTEDEYRNRRSIRLYLESLSENLNEIDGTLSIFEETVRPLDLMIRRLPDEKPAPIRVEVQDNKIKLSNPKHQKGSINIESVEKLRRSASETLRRALDVMRAADNLDRRFVPACEPLLSDLLAEYTNLSIESLGHNWELVSKLLNRFHDEVPDVAFIQLEQALQTTNVIINQFEEWRSYLEAKVATKISEHDAEIIVAEAVVLGDEIADKPDIADASIAQRLRDITLPVTSGVTSAESIVAPLVGSLSNIFSVLSRITLELGAHLESIVISAGHLIDKGVGHALFIAAIGMLGKHAKKLAHLPPFTFMRDAYEVATKQFPWAKDTLFK